VSLAKKTICCLSFSTGYEVKHCGGDGESAKLAIILPAEVLFLLATACITPTPVGLY